MGIQGGGAGYDDEPGHDVSKDAAGDHIQSGRFVLAPGHTFFNDRSLQIKLHPGSDRGPHHGDHHIQIARLAKHFAGRWLNRGDERVDPGWFRQDTGEDISHIKERSDQENLFHGLVLALEHDYPHDECADWNRDVLGKPEQLETAGDTRELSHYVAEIDDQDPDHHEERDSEPKLFADEVTKSLAGNSTHTGRDLLNHDQRQCGRDHGP